MIVGTFVLASKSTKNRELEVRHAARTTFGRELCVRSFAGRFLLYVPAAEALGSLLIMGIIKDGKYASLTYPDNSQESI